MKIAYIYVRAASSCSRVSAWAYNHGMKHASLPADVAWFIQHYHTRSKLGAFAGTRAHGPSD